MENAQNIMSFFNLNLDIVNPECVIEGFDYTTKWYLTVLSPVMFFGIFSSSTIITGIRMAIIRVTGKGNKVENDDSGEVSREVTASRQ